VCSAGDVFSSTFTNKWKQEDTILTWYWPLCLTAVYYTGTKVHAVSDAVIELSVSSALRVCVLP
jgi:hypothetical protein